MEPNPKNPRRIPGRLRGRTLEKSVSIRNRLRSYGQGYALAISQLDDAERQKATEVKLQEKETGQTRIAPISLIRQRGIPLHFAGYEPQLALPLSLWRFDDPRQPDLFEGLQ